MNRVVDVVIETMPAMRLVGKMYKSLERTNGSYSKKWSEWFAMGWFDQLEKLGEVEGIENGQIGLIRSPNFEYWIGMFLPADTTVPPGFAYVDLPAGNVAMCFVQGNAKDGSLYNHHDICVKALEEKGLLNLRKDKNGQTIFFERYNCPRFIEENQDGHVILDYGAYIED